MKTNKTKRVLLNKSPIWVDPETAAILKVWRGFYGIPYGRSIDAMVAYIRSRPDFRIPMTGKRPSLIVYERKP